MTTDESQVEAVLRASWEDEVGVAELFTALSDATLLLAVIAPGAESAYAVEFNGINWAVACTSQATTAMLPAAPAWFEIRGSELARRLPEELSLLINPGSGPLTRAFMSDGLQWIQAPEGVPATQPDGTALAPWRTWAEARRLADPMHTEDEDADEDEFGLSAPELEPSPELIAAVRDALDAARAVIAGVYLFDVTQVGGPRRRFLGVEAVDAQSRNEAVAAVESSLRVFGVADAPEVAELVDDALLAVPLVGRRIT